MITGNIYIYKQDLYYKRKTQLKYNKEFLNIQAGPIANYMITSYDYFVPDTVLA